MEIANKQKIYDEFFERLGGPGNAAIEKGLMMPITMGQLVFEKEGVERVADNLMLSMKQMGFNMSKEVMLFYSMFKTLVDKNLGEDNIIPEETLLLTAHLGHIYHKGELEENPYYKNIEGWQVRTGL